MSTDVHFDTEQTAIWTLNSIVHTMARQLLDGGQLNRDAFKSSLVSTRHNISTRSDMDYQAAKQLLDQYLSLVGWEAP